MRDRTRSARFFILQVDSYYYQKGRGGDVFRKKKHKYWKKNKTLSIRREEKREIIFIAQLSRLPTIVIKKLSVSLA